MIKDQYNGVAVITVEGDLLGAEAAAVERAVEQIAGEPRSDASHRAGCVIDLDRCRFMTSEGLESLLAALRTCESKGTPLKLAGLDGNCQTVLRITRLDHRFDCCPDVAAALKMMS